MKLDSCNWNLVWFK